MIKVYDNYFVLETNNISYIMHVNKVGYLLTDYFGNKITIGDDKSFLGFKEAFSKGGNCVVDKDDWTFSADNALQEYSFCQKGDFKEPSIILKNKTRGYTFDFRYLDYELKEDFLKLENLPNIHNIESELVIKLKEAQLDLVIELHYVLCKDQDVISKFVKVVNNTNEDVEIQKISSLQLDIINKDYELVNLNGAWISETHKETQKIHTGIYINDSKVGTSSSRHNPFFIIKQGKTDEMYGECYSFNLIYSGNHQELVELTTYDHLHIQTGINPYLFNWILKNGEYFTSPIAVMTYSSSGLNELSNRMHNFINSSVVNEKFAYCPRPILINNWEGTYFKFNESKLLSIAKSAKKFGIELFVLDDGWFSTRNDDTQGLGDYDVNKKKLPGGLERLSKKINNLGLKFGLWFEPESINEKSKLYNSHPDWVIKTQNVKPSEGRNQFLLNLTIKEVRDYIYQNISNILSSSSISYIKWDMNRNMTDICFNGFDAGEFYHRYYLGLYELMDRLTKSFPDVLFENCSSGGNRLDLGMSVYFPQTWASDDSDPYERISIQEGLSYGYPQSMYTGHVSHRSNHQLLRSTPYSTKFNVASFAVLGYELSLDELNAVEKKEIKNQIEFYKEHRNLFQYGDFYRLKTKDFEGDTACWMIKSHDNKEAVIGYYNGLQSSRPKETILKGFGFNDNKKYKIEVLNQEHDLKLFGNLVNMVLPVHVNCDGLIVNTIAKYKTMNMEKESYEVFGNVLNNGIILKCEWAGNGFSDNVRILGDFGSRIYYIKQID